MSINRFNFDLNQNPRCGQGKRNSLDWNKTINYMHSGYKWRKQIMSLIAPSKVEWFHVKHVDQILDV
jgi:hypothetical protein